MPRLRLSTSTLAGEEFNPWLASAGELAYSPHLPERDYYFQYSWVIPGIFRAGTGVRRHFWFGGPLKDSTEVKLLFAFWNRTRQGELDALYVANGISGAIGMLVSVSRPTIATRLFCKTRFAVFFARARRPSRFAAGAGPGAAGTIAGCPFERGDESRDRRGDRARDATSCWPSLFRDSAAPWSRAQLSRCRYRTRRRRQRGVKFGRKPRLTSDQINHARKLIAKGEPRPIRGRPSERRSFHALSGISVVRSPHSSISNPNGGEDIVEGCIRLQSPHDL